MVKKKSRIAQLSSIVYRISRKWHLTHFSSSASSVSFLLNHKWIVWICHGHGLNGKRTDKNRQVSTSPLWVFLCGRVFFSAGKEKLIRSRLQNSTMRFLTVRKTKLFAWVVRDGLAKLSRFAGSCVRYQVASRHKCVLLVVAFIDSVQHCESEFSRSEL